MALWKKGRSCPLAEALIEAGADLNFQRDGKGDTPLIGAASPGAEDVGIRLVHAGANPLLRGLFGETALHWAAMLGEDRLVAELTPGSDLNLKDQKYNSPPLGWAIQGWSNSPAGHRGRQRDVIVLPLAARAKVEPEWVNSEKVQADAEILEAMKAGTLYRL